MANAFTNLLDTIEGNIGIDTLLVFLLVFTLLYAILNKTKIIGEGKKNFNMVISLVLSLLTVIPHHLGTVAAENDPVLIITSALPNISIIIVAILGVLLLVGVFGKNLDIVGTSLAGIIAILAFVVVLFIFGSAAGWWGDIPQPLGFLNDEDTQSILIMILVFAVVIWYITRDDSNANVGGGFGKMLKGIGDSIK